MMGRGENRSPGPRGQPDTQRPWMGGLLPSLASQHQHLRLPDSPEGHVEVSGAAVLTVHEQMDPDGSQRRERCASQWGGLEPAGSSPPPPPPSSSLPPPGSSWPSRPQPWSPVSLGVSHTDITDECRPIPPKMELILCSPSSAPRPPNPTVSTDSPGRPKAPRRTYQAGRSQGREVTCLEQRSDLCRVKGSPWGSAASQMSGRHREVG